MAETRRIHPLEGRIHAQDGFLLEPAPACERLSLRATEENPAALGRALAIKLPVKPGSSTVKGEQTALWLGPDEWLVLAPEGANLAQELNKMEGALFSAVDISHRNTAMIASGPRTAGILNCGCPLDLSLKGFPKGTCTRTILAKSEIILYREENERFRVECWRSYSDYVWHFLLDAAKSV
jgi:sarcosine oxidase, subunit gamma